MYTNECISTASAAPSIKEAYAKKLLDEIMKALAEQTERVGGLYSSMEWVMMPDDTNPEGENA